MRAAVTGAFGYSGRYIARRLLEAGHEVITLTNSLNWPNPFGERVKGFPFNFDDPRNLRQTLKSVDALINTYWMRFNHRRFTHAEAVENTKEMFGAAREARGAREYNKPGRQRGVALLRGKAELEASLKATGMSYCILRPTVLFGKEGVLINNIAWALRRLPVIGVFGSGEYRCSPSMWMTFPVWRRRRSVAWRMKHWKR